MKLKFDKNGSLVAEDKMKSKETPDTFQAQQKILGGLDKLKIGSGKNAIPIGESVLGGASSVLISEVIDGVMPTNLKGGIASSVIRLVAGIFIMNIAKPIIGQGSADIGKAFITFDSLRDVIPVDQWIRGVTSTFRAGQPQAPVGAYGMTHNDELDAWLHA
jgi:hypothetical protein